jgi:hypothetical protein
MPPQGEVKSRRSALAAGCSCRSSAAIACSLDDPAILYPVLATDPFAPIFVGRNDFIRAGETIMATNITEMTFEEWLHKDGKFRMMDIAEMRRAGNTTQAIFGKLRKAVAYYLYIASKDVPGDKAGLYRAAALALIDKPVDPVLMEIAGERNSDDDPLHSNDLCAPAIPEIEEVWQYHHRIEIEAAERAYDAAHSPHVGLSAPELDAALRALGAFDAEHGVTTAALAKHLAGAGADKSQINAWQKMLEDKYDVFGGYVVDFTGLPSAFRWALSK